MTTFYFAHPTTMYNTGAEQQLMARFQRTHPGVGLENPNKPEHSDGYAREGMDYFIHLCDGLDGVAFAPFADGTLGAGVAKEVRSFQERGVPVLEFDARTGDFVKLSPEAKLAARDVAGTRERLNQERALKEQGQDPYRDLGTFRSSILDVTA